MKDIKCPLCDSKLVKRCACDYESIVALTCLNCGYQILDEVDLNLIRNNEYNHALSISDHEAAERFISKFPSIMKLNKRDKIKYVNIQGKIKCDTIRFVDLKEMKIILDAGLSIYPADVWKWPWELEQKGGK